MSSQIIDTLATIPQVKTSIFNRSKSKKSKDDSSVESNEANIDSYLETNGV